MKVRYTDRACIDLETAFEWYQGQRIGLGFEFLDCLEATISTIQQMPELYHYTPNTTLISDGH